MQLQSLEHLYLHQLRDLYHAENQLLAALPKMADAAHDPKLKETFRNHLQETRSQIDRLKTVFKKLDADPTGESCEAMQGLIEETDDVLEAEADEEVRDAALIADAQRIEHYEMAGYGTVRTYAKKLGYDDQAQVLQSILDEEKAADEKLNELAETRINQRAMA